MGWEGLYNRVPTGRQWWMESRQPIAHWLLEISLS